MRIRSYRRRALRKPLILAAGQLLTGVCLWAQGTEPPRPPVTPTPETLLTPKHAVALTPGEHFAVPVPMRLENMLNLGSAELRITLSPDTPQAAPGSTVILLAHLNTAQALLPRGDRTLLLHGVVPQVAPVAYGPYHPAEYAIHLGSGTLINTPSPDDRFIDTATLARQLAGLRLTLVEADRK